MLNETAKSGFGNIALLCQLGGCYGASERDLIEDVIVVECFKRKLVLFELNVAY